MSDFSHAPGGLGVLELVFLAGMPGVPQADVLAALLVFRLLYLIVPVLLYLVCSAALPSMREPANLDLRESYFASSRYFSGLLFAYVAATILQAYLARGSVEWTPLTTVLRVGILVVLAPLVWIRSAGYHWFAAIFMLVVLALRMMTQTLQ